MNMISKQLENLITTYPLEQLAPFDQILFIDIETTGFTAKSSYLYLIGCIFYNNNQWELKQWFATNYEDEENVLRSFACFAKDFSYLIHFNGNNFDIPYMMQKYNSYQIPFSFDTFTGTDIYKRIAPYKKFMKLPNCKQKTLETYLGIFRQDCYNGGELISVYHDYVKNPSEASYESLLLHNQEDMIGMFQLLPIFSYVDLFNNPLKVTKVQANYYKDVNGEKRQEVVMKCKLSNPLPVAISNYANHCFFTARDLEATIKVPLYETELKYYYSNYKDYYYLPKEDIALHKSVSTFVDKEHRIQATASNCYTRKSSSYLPQWDIFFEPFFKKEYKDHVTYFELTDELKQERELFQNYALHIIQMIRLHIK